MGKSVKSATKGVGNLGKGLLGSGTGGLLGLEAASIGKKYDPETTGFKQTEAQKAYQARLKARSEGKETSLAEMQLKESQDRAAAQQAAAVSSARGNQALAQREAIRAGAGVQQETARAAAQIRAQEQEAALGAYGQDLAREASSLQQLENVRAGIGAQQQQLQFAANQQAGANRMAMMQEGAKTAQAVFSDEDMKKDVKSENFKDMQKKWDIDVNKLLPKKEESSSSGGGGLGKGLLSGLLASDKNLKTNIKPKHIEDMVSKLHAYKFKYKEPNGEPYQEGQVTGIMAQDLEKSKLGKSLVSDTPQGKQVDLKKAVPLMMASVSEIVKKIKKLENKKG